MEARTEIIMIGAAGRMGRTICSLAQSEDAFELVGAVDAPGKLEGLASLGCKLSAKLEDLLPLAPKAVLVDFTAPAASLENARIAGRHGRAIVIGTTGLNPEQKGELAELAKAAPVFWSANMSIGVNVLMRILPELAKALGPQYDLEMVEIHHRHKKDSPSGTALSLGEAIASARDWNLQDVRCSARDGLIGERPEREIGIQAIRGGDVVGVHTVYFLGPGERIEVSHHAHSRENFAQGALRAARWLNGQKPGRLYCMQDTF